MPNLSKTVGRVRLCGIVEGISFIVLLLIAMPLKYFFGQPLLVKYVGWAHGLLFTLYALTILHAWAVSALSFGRSVMAFIAAFIPFGPFIIDQRLAQDEMRERVGGE